MHRDTVTFLALRRALQALFFATCALATGCGGDDATPPVAAAAVILGVEGGVVEGPDGVRLVVPAGALSDATGFGIARDGSGAPPLGGAKPIAPIYEVTPHGAAFGAPALIRIPFEASALPVGAQAVILKVSPGGEWEALPTQTDADGLAVTADVPSLSWFTVGTCFTRADVSVPGPDPIFGCPNAHRLQLSLYDAAGNVLPVPRTASGTALPVMTITEPTTLEYALDWRRPANVSRVDRLSMIVSGMGLAPAQQPLAELPVNGDFTRRFATTVDPSKVAGSTAADGAIVTLRGNASYTTDAFYPGCLCFKPATWTFAAELKVRVKYTAPPPPPAVPVAPTVALQPADTTVGPGQAASFTMRFGGTTPMDVQMQQLVGGQWQNLGAPRASADGSASFATGALSAAATFRFVGSNAAGSVVTREAAATLVAAGEWTDAVALSSGPGYGFAAASGPASFLAAVQRGGRVEGLPGSSAAGWGNGALLDTAQQPGSLSAIGGDSIAGDGNGSVVALWTTTGAPYGLMASVHAAGTGWAAAQRLDRGNGYAGYQQVAVRSSGAAAVWHEYPNNENDALLAIRTASGWQAARQLNLAGTPSYDIQVSINAQGAGLAVFRERDSAIVVVPFDTAGNVGTRQVLRQAAAGLRVPRVAMYDDGSAVVVWLEARASGYDLMFSRLSGSGWNTPALLAADVGLVGNSAMVMASNGTAAVLAYSHGGAGARVRYHRDTPQGGFEAAVAVTAAGVDSYSPRVALAANGAFAIAWEQAGEVAVVRVFRSTGTHDRVLTTPGWRSLNRSHEVAMTPTGQAAVLWYEFSGSNSNNGRLMASFWPG